MLIAGPALWMLGSILNSCQIYERADGHVQILQQSVHIPFLLGSLLFFVAAVLNGYEQVGSAHHGLKLLVCAWIFTFFCRIVNKWDSVCYVISSIYLIELMLGYICILVFLSQLMQIVRLQVKVILINFCLVLSIGLYLLHNHIFLLLSSFLTFLSGKGHVEEEFVGI